VYQRAGGRGLKILVEGWRVERVTRFKCLGSIVSSGGCCGRDIGGGVVVGRQAFGDYDKNKKIQQS